MSSLPVPRNTSLILIALAFVTGAALGWLLRDIFPASLDSQPNIAAATVTLTPTETTATPSLVPVASATPPPLSPAVQPSPSSTIAPTATSSPTATPLPPIVSYSVYTVGAGESLESIAANGGSDAALIERYNLLTAPPQPGRALVVPRLKGRMSVLTPEAALIERGRADLPRVALTLDAGAGSEPVPSILATLRERDIRVTFFLTGAWVRDNPDLARQIVADGHEIANHSLNHPDFRDLENEQIVDELDSTERLIKEIAGVTARPFFRPPYGAYDRRVLLTVAEQGYLPIYWTLDSLDSVGEPKTPEFLVERVTTTLTAEELRGAIILAHCGSAATAEALPTILDRFDELGLEVRPLSEVL